MVKFYTVKKEINGTEYEAQFNGMSAALQAIDNSYIDGGSNISLEKLSKYVFAHVIVNPKGLTAEDFDDWDTLNEVVAFGRNVMQGRIKPEKEDKKAKDKAE